MSNVGVNMAPAPAPAPADEIELTCGVYGEATTVSVKVARDAKVAELQKAIFNVKRYEARYTFAASDLTLRLARKNDQWMPVDENMIPLLRGSIDPGYELMLLGPLKPSKYFKPNVDLGDKVIHVLVELPTYKRDLAKIGISNMPPERKLQIVAELKKNCPKRGLLPTTGDFLDLLTWGDADCGQVKDITAINDIVGFTGSTFYVRKEILCVLENFNNFKRNADGVQKLTQQFVLLESPGTGKSCVLALICFYIAVELKLPVLWLCEVAFSQAHPVTRLLHDGYYYEWTDKRENTAIYTMLYMAVHCGRVWGLNQEDLINFDLQNHFQVLATSGEFDVKSEANADVETCLLPYWRKADLVMLGHTICLTTCENISDRFFASGGNLQYFMDISILRNLTDVIAPRFFEMLVENARDLNDDCLEDAALESYFHAVVRHCPQQSLRVEYVTYDNGMVPPHLNSIKKVGNGSIICPPPKHVERKGNSMEN